MELLCYDFGVKKENVWFITDCKEKANVAKVPRYAGVNVILGDYLDWSTNMKFDVICGNPPYNNDTTNKAGGGARNDLLWPDFVKRSLALVKENGFLCLVHPQMWRKPEHNMWNVIGGKQLLYLEIHGEEDGRKVFGVGSKYDWYVMENAIVHSATTVKDENGKTHSIDLRDWAFLPSFKIEEISHILIKKNDSACDVIYDCCYHGQKTKATNAGKYVYPVIHSINAEGPTIRYSDRNKLHFGVPKVIVNDARNIYPINDYKGEYGMSEQTFGIPVSSKKEGDLVVAALSTPKFQEILKATKWSNFRTDYKMFRAFKKDFWKQFVDENGNEIK